MEDYTVQIHGRNEPRIKDITVFVNLLISFWTGISPYSYVPRNWPVPNNTIRRTWEILNFSWLKIKSEHSVQVRKIELQEDVVLSLLSLLIGLHFLNCWLIRHHYSFFHPQYMLKLCCISIHNTCLSYVVFSETMYCVI